MLTSKLMRAACAATLLLLLFYSRGGRAQTPAPPSPSNPSQSVSPAQPATAEPAAQQPMSPFPEMVPDESGTGLTVLRAIESYSELTLKGSDLHAVEPLLGSREKTPDFVRELWQLRWRPNDPIDLWVILPRGVKNPPVVLYLYGYPSETDRFRNSDYCRRITHGGVAAVGFVSAFTGHRTEYRPLNETFTKKLPEALVSTVHDIQMILDYLQTRGDLDMNHVGIFGQGSGGSIAILTAAVEPRLKVLDLLDPWGDWPAWFAGEPDFQPIERAEYLKPDFQKAIEPLDPLRSLPQLKSQKIRMQFDADTGEPKEAVDRIAAAAPGSAQVVRFPSSRDMYSANSGGRLFEWIATQLGAHPALPATAEVSATPDKPNSPVRPEQPKSAPAKTN